MTVKYAYLHYAQRENLQETNLKTKLSYHSFRHVAIYHSKNKTFVGKCNMKQIYP